MKRFFSLRHRVQTGCGAHPPSYTMGTADSSPGVKWPGREAAHLHLMPRLRMRGAIPAIPHAFSHRGAWFSTKTTHPLRCQTWDFHRPTPKLKDQPLPAVMTAFPTYSQIPGGRILHLNPGDVPYRGDSGESRGDVKFFGSFYRKEERVAMDFIVPV